MAPVITIATHGLTKRFGTVVAVDDLNLQVTQGELYALLGRNGAGKTTTIRALLGMVRPTNGHAEMLGVAIKAGVKGVWGRVGHLVETPTAYPELAMRENLEVARRLYRVADSGAATTALERLGRAPYADRRAGTLSLGNLQRLGLARALLHDPEVLVLDEPANGLDPAGVVEVRELLRGMVRGKGTTVLMSSHILSEVDRLATRVGIIHGGRLVEELDASELERQRRRHVIVDARDREAARAVLRGAGYTVATRAGGMLGVTDARAVEAPDELARLLVSAGMPPTRLCIEGEDLEEHFLRITAGIQ